MDFSLKIFFTATQKKRINGHFTLCCYVILDDAFHVAMVYIFIKNKTKIMSEIDSWQTYLPV